MGGSTPASAQAFELTADKFRETYDARLKQDGRDSIAACRTSRFQVVCRFHGDPNFGAGGLFRRIDHSELMTLDILDKKLAQITLTGQRNTSAAQRHFIGLVTAALGALSPGLDRVKIAGIVSGLGLSRDDSAPNIGESMSQSEPYWNISCLNQYSQVSTDMACTIVPSAP